MTEPDPELAALVHAALGRLTPSEWLPDPQGVSVQSLSAGAYHHNFLVTSNGRRCVARWNRTSQWGLTSRQQLHREFAVLTDLRHSGVTPIPYALIDDDLPLLIESFIDSSPFRYGPDLASCANAIAAVHCQEPIHSRPALPAEPPQQFLLDDGAEWLRRAEATGGQRPSTDLLRRAMLNLKELPVLHASNKVIVHTDLIHSNILLTTDGCAIVDWEGARLGPAAWDLSYFLSPVTLRWAPEECLPISPSDRRSFLVTYAEAVNRDVEVIIEEVEDLLPFVIFRALAWCVGFEQFERHSVDVAARLSSFTDPKFIAEHAFIDNSF